MIYNNDFTDILINENEFFEELEEINKAEIEVASPDFEDGY
jgi:hypothetical protein